MALQQDSLVSRIADLDIGKSYSHTVMVGRSKDGDLKAEITDTKRRLRNLLNKQMERATTATNAMFRLDCGSWHANEDAAIFITVAVTRIM
jgi:hypothetical protein